MNLLEFTRRFPDEASCRAYLRQKRQEQGLVCKRCQSKKHYWLSTIEKWKCAECGSRTNLRSGTMMEQSHLPVLYWFTAIHLLTSTKKSISALELQRQLGHKFYEPIWYMLHKIRMVMGARDERYKLKGEIEMDDSFFEVVERVQRDEMGNIVKSEEQQKRGRGSQRQAKVLVMVESTSNPRQSDRNKKNRVMGYVKMIVVDELTSEDINEKVEENVEYESTALTDGYKSYSQLKFIIKKHLPQRIPAKEAHKILPWVHTVISNAKRLFLGIHHSIRREYLQNYLNCYCYKLNRRYFCSDLFEKMIIAGVNNRWY